MRKTAGGLGQHGVGVFAAGIGVSAINLVTGILVARLLGPDGRGGVAAVVLYLVPLGFLAGIGIPQAHAFLVAQEGDRANEAYGNSLIAGTLLGTLFGAIGWVSVPHLLHAQARDVVRIAQWAMLTTPLMVVLGMIKPILQGLHRFPLVNVHSLLKSASYAIGLLALWGLSRLSVFSVAAVQVLVPLAVSALFLIWVRRRLNLSGISFSAGLLQRSTRFGLKAQVGYALALTNAKLATAFVANRLDSRQLGLFVVATSASGFLLALQNPFNLILMPAVARRSREGRYQLIAKAFRIGAIFFGSFALALFVLGDWLVVALFGPSFTDSIFPMKIAVMGYVAVGLIDIVDRACEGIGRPILTATGRGGGLIAMSLGLWVLVPRFGINGAALGFTFGMTVNLVIMLLALRRVRAIVGLKDLVPRAGDFHVVIKAVWSWIASVKQSIRFRTSSEEEEIQ